MPASIRSFARVRPQVLLQVAELSESALRRTARETGAQRAPERLDGPVNAVVLSQVGGRRESTTATLADERLRIDAVGTLVNVPRMGDEIGSRFERLDDAMQSVAKTTT
jgi:hypothetical protein